MTFELLFGDVWIDVVIESLASVVTGGVVVLEFLVPVSYFVEVWSDVLVVMVEELAVGIGVEVFADVNVNVSKGVVTALAFSMPIS